MTPNEILSELEARRVELRVAGDRLRIRPASRVPESLLEELRSHKTEVVEIVSLRGWPEASREAVRRHGQPWARLYPFLGKSILTPRGGARLVGVLPERVTVVLAGEPENPSVFLPSELRPPGVAPCLAFPESRVH